MSNLITMLRSRVAELRAELDDVDREFVAIYEKRSVLKERLGRYEKALEAETADSSVFLPAKPLNTAAALLDVGAVMNIFGPAAASPVANGNGIHAKRSTKVSVVLDTIRQNPGLPPKELFPLLPQAPSGEPFKINELYFCLQKLASSGRAKRDKEGRYHAV